MIEAKRDYVITKQIKPSDHDVKTAFNVGDIPKKDEVVSVGEGVEGVVVGDIIVVDLKDAVVFEHEGVFYRAVPERSVVAKVGHNE